PVTLVRTQFPSFQEMSSGEGTIRIEALATCSSPPGRHSLIYQNNHRSDISVYLVNALVPPSPKVEITEQNRDPLQRRIHLSFMVKSGAERSTEQKSGY